MKAKRSDNAVKHIADLPDNFVVIITGPALTYKKKLVTELEKNGFLRVPTFTTKPKTYEDDDFYVRVKEDNWEGYVRENFVCVNSIHGYRYAVNWSTVQGLLKSKRPLVVSLDAGGMIEFVEHLPTQMRGIMTVSVLCRDKDILNVRLAQYARTNKDLSLEHINNMAYMLQDTHLHYEGMNANIKVFLLHDNNVEEIAQTIRDQVVQSYISEMPEVGARENVKTQ
jgi:hypothetical protein